MGSGEQPRGESSCRARVERALAAIEETQPATNAFTSMCAEQALADADQLDALEPMQRGPLHGVPLAVKELFDVAGLPTTGACAAYLHRVATADAAAVAALRRAGAIVVAKTNQHELGAGATGLVSCFGAVANPADHTRITGGSSSGSAAAVAAGVVPLALGSDTGGSIRMPASFCGVTGLRPTPHRISLAGAQPMSPGFDTAGPLARTARECAAAFSVLATTSSLPARPWQGAVADVRVGLPRPYFELVHRESRAAVEAAASAFEALGARVVWVDEPGIDMNFDGFRHVWADVAHHHPDLWDDERVNPEVAALIDTGRAMRGVEYAASRAAAELMRRRFDEAFRHVDVLLTPATPYPAPHLDQEEVAVDGGRLDVRRGAPSRLTVPVNEAAVPAVAFPVGTSSDGLPIGAQLIGRPCADEQLLALVSEYQER